MSNYLKKSRPCKNCGQWFFTDDVKSKTNMERRLDEVKDFLLSEREKKKENNLDTKEIDYFIKNI